MLHFFEGKKILTNLLFLLAVMILGQLTLIIAASDKIKDVLYEDRQVKTRHLVESTHSLLKYYNGLVTSGELTLAQAQQQAINTIRSLRYEKDEYFWINDMHPRIIMHPFKPELDGQDVSASKDANGKKLFMAMIDVVRQDGAGFVDYYWPKPGAAEPVEKISYVKGYEPWGWLVGSGIYIDDVDEIYFDQLLSSLLVFTLLMIIIIFFSTLITKAIVDPLQVFKLKLSEIRSNHDLTIRMQVNSSNEVGEMGTALNELISSFQSSLKEVEQTSLQSIESAIHTKTQSMKTLQGVENTHSQTEQLASAMNEMAATVNEVASSASSASDAAREADEQTNNGMVTVNATIDVINQLATEISNGAETIKLLDEEVNSISRVVDVINGIAEQTNLLALNAAIEAARAGDQGRGFAVVAGEVRTLAQKTQESTEEILHNIESLQRVASAAVKSMMKSREQTDTSVDKAAEAGTALHTIADVVSKISDMNLQIATAAEEQSQVTDEMNRNVHVIADVANETADGAQQTAAASEQINSLTEQLQEKISQYKT
jgi:methyl-accepting chemotaxis protein